jgi:hypothetical protein
MDTETHTLRDAREELRARASGISEKLKDAKAGRTPTVVHGRAAPTNIAELEAELASVQSELQKVELALSTTKLGAAQ